MDKSDIVLLQTELEFSGRCVSYIAQEGGKRHEYEEEKEFYA